MITGVQKFQIFGGDAVMTDAGAKPAYRAKQGIDNLPHQSWVRRAS